MPDARRPLTLVELARQPQIGDVIIDHAYRGARVQRLLRLVLLVFLAAVLVFEPPLEGQALCWVIVALYGIWSVVAGVLVKVGGRRMLRYVWLAVLVDVVAIAAVTLVAADADPLSWTAYLLINGFFLLPVIAATQLSPWVCAAALGPTVVVYLVASLITRETEIEPISSPILRTALLAGVGVGCVLLSRLQRSRVLTIGQLAGERAELVGELLTVEEREQRDLAEVLHDGALQYVLARAAGSRGRPGGSRQLGVLGPDRLRAGRIVPAAAVDDGPAASRGGRVGGPRGGAPRRRDHRRGPRRPDRGSRCRPVAGNDANVSRRTAAEHRSGADHQCRQARRSRSSGGESRAGRRDGPAAGQRQRQGNGRCRS